MKNSTKVFKVNQEFVVVWSNDEAAIVLAETATDKELVVDSLAEDELDVVDWLVLFALDVPNVGNCII